MPGHHVLDKRRLAINPRIGGHEGVCAPRDHLLHVGDREALDDAIQRRLVGGIAGIDVASARDQQRDLFEASRPHARVNGSVPVAVARVDVLAPRQQEVSDLLGGREVHEPRLAVGSPQVRADLAALDRARHGLDVPGGDDLLDVRGQGLA